MQKLKRHLISLACLAALFGAAPAMAGSSYFLMVPVAPRDNTPIENIEVALAGGSMPAAQRTKPYSHSLANRLQITGDSALDESLAEWSVSGGALPPGLTLSPAGLVAGIPEVANESGASFQVKASYKGKNGEQLYTIIVDDFLLNVSQISPGYEHTCAITPEGSVMCWGRGAAGALGNGTTANKLTPTLVPGLNSVVSLTTGQTFSCALRKNGGVKCWGRNGFGETGTGSLDASVLTPTDVVGLTSGVVAISGRYSHACALLADGSVQCWGNGANSRLGKGSSGANMRAPRILPDLTNIVALETGENHSCALNSEGVLKCWGHNGVGQLGNGTTTLSASAVTVLNMAPGIASFSVGASHNCAILTNGVTRCWGYNYSGEIGDGSKVNRLTAVPIGISNLKELKLGHGSSCAITENNTVACWGLNNLGQLGTGGTTGYTTPTAIPGLTGVTGLSLGYRTACGKSDSGLKCWGSNGFGEVGDGTTTNRYSPTPVSGW